MFQQWWEQAGCTSTLLPPIYKRGSARRLVALGDLADRPWAVAGRRHNLGERRSIRQQADELPAPPFCCGARGKAARRDFRTAQGCGRIRRGRCNQPIISCATCRYRAIMSPIRFRHACTTTRLRCATTLRHAPGAVVHSTVLFPGARVCISARRVDMGCGTEWRGKATVWASTMYVAITPTISATTY